MWSFVGQADLHIFNLKSRINPKLDDGGVIRLVNVATSEDVGLSVGVAVRGVSLHRERRTIAVRRQAVPDGESLSVPCQGVRCGNVEILQPLSHRYELNRRRTKKFGGFNTEWQHGDCGRNGWRTQRLG